MAYDIAVKRTGNVYVKVYCEPAVTQELSDFFTFSVPGASFSPDYKKGHWDGKIRLFSKKTGQIYAGLVDYIRSFAKMNGYSILVEKDNSSAPERFSLKDFSLPEKFTPREYQLASLAYAIFNKRCNIVSPTASGKSLIIYMITRYLLDHGKKRGLLIVPTVSLVHQMYGDFKEYGWDVEKNCQMIYQGQMKAPTASLVISTWQSIYDLPKEYFTKFDFVIGDEAHQFKAKSLTGIMNKLVNCDYRIGTTGTIDETNVHKLVLEGLFGPVKSFATTSELIKAKYLADFEIKCWVIQYPEEVRRSLNGREYHEEIDFLCGYDPRNKLISNLASTLDGNTLILYNYVDKHGKVLYELLKENIKGRKIFFVCGKTDVEDREEFRRLTELETDAIIIASYGTFSTGINIKNLHNVVFASPTKSRIRTLQSIGRGLRIGNNKDKATLYDIADDLRYKSYVNYTLKHYEARVKIYGEQRFPFRTYNIGIK